MLLPPAPPLYPMPLPSDSLRIDLLFADETRFLNSRYYLGNIDQLSYLIALQMSLGWVDENVYNNNFPRLHYDDQGYDNDGNDFMNNFGYNVDLFALNADVSVRPSVRLNDEYGVCHRYKKLIDMNDDKSSVEEEGSSLGADSLPQLNMEAASSNGGDSEIKMLYPIKDNIKHQNKHHHHHHHHHHHRHEYLQKLEEYSSSSEENSESEYDESVNREYTGMNYEHNYYDNNEYGEGEEEEEDDDEGDTFTDIFESVATDQSPLTIIDHSKVLDTTSISPSYLEGLEAKLKTLGISPSEDLLFKIVSKMNEFQNFAKDVNVPLTCHRMRYYLKRMYLQYLFAWPLFGCHFFQGILLNHSISGDVTVVIAIGTSGLYLLEPNNWSLIFHASLADIERCNIQSADALNRPGVIQTSKLFYLCINGMDLELITSSAYELKRLLVSCAIETLAHGVFPHGSEGGEDINDISFDVITKSTDTQYLLQRFYSIYESAPAPPKPPQLDHSEYYFKPPRGQRHILNDKRVKLSFPSILNIL